MLTDAEKHWTDVLFSLEFISIKHLLPTLRVEPGVLGEEASVIPLGYQATVTRRKIRGLSCMFCMLA